MEDFVVKCDEGAGAIRSLKLYGKELLEQKQAGGSEFLVNGIPLKMRLYQPAGATRPLENLARMKGERFVDHFCGWGLVLSRSMGLRNYAKYPSFGIQYHIRRERADQTNLPCPGPGGPVIEAPLHVDTFTLPRLDWRFWGDDTRMIFASAHSSGPVDEFGHCGYEHGTPEACKAFMRNVWRRIYPGGMVIHGAVFHNVKTDHWISITCRRAQVGYILNIEDAGRGVAFDYTLHAPFNLGESLTMPEIIFNYGLTKESMNQFIADYAAFNLKEAPAWVDRTHFRQGLGWDNQPTWKAQADLWEREHAEGLFSGIHINLVTDRPICSGTTPKGYQPDPNHGTPDEFRRMCRRMADCGVPMIIWMSHSGLMYRGGPEIDDDWFIRGIDGRFCAAWGSEDHPEIVHINPGHPGYIEYTEKWIRFYIKECGCKGIFLDCLAWAFPPDFAPRSFMRFPGDTNRMAVKFMERVHSCVKECDPEAILIGEGSSTEFPIEAYSIVSNPRRAEDGLGPRDFIQMLSIRSVSPFSIYGESSFSLAGRYCTGSNKPEHAKLNKFYTCFLRENGMGGFSPLPGDLAVDRKKKLLAVPVAHNAAAYPSLKLGKEFAKVAALRSLFDGSVVKRRKDASFGDVPPGIYEMK